MKKLVTCFAVAMMAAIPLAGCERNEGALEETGENVDQGLEDAGQQIDEGTRQE